MSTKQNKDRHQPGRERPGGGGQSARRSKPAATVADLQKELEQEAKATRRVLERVPEDHLGWKPHDKSMTMGQLAMHVATLPGAIVEISALPGFDVEVPRPGATSIRELLAAFDESLATATLLLAQMDDAALETPWRMVRGDQEISALTRGAVLRSILLNHWYHHRGQLTVYLRLAGALVPAVYGASADEDPSGAPVRDSLSVSG